VRDISYWRIILTIFVTLLATIFAMPNFTNVTSSWLPQKSINLGLDLRGGSHLLLDVDLNHYLKDQYEMLTDTLRKELREGKIGYKNLRPMTDYIVLELRTPEDIDSLKKTIRNIDKEIWFEQKDNKINIRFSEDKISELHSRVLDQSMEIVRMRVDSTGTTEPTIQRQGEKHILLQVPGASNPSALRSMLGKTAKLTFHLVNEDASIEQALQGHVPGDSMLSYEEQVHTLFTMLACMRRVVPAAEVSLLQIAMARGLSLRQSQVTAPRRAAVR